MSIFTIPINTTKEKYYIQVISLFQDMPPFNQLRTQEKIVLGWLMFFYNELKVNNTAEATNSLLFTGKNQYKNYIVSKLMISEEDGAYGKAYANFNNILTALRKKGFITKKGNSNTLNNKYIFDYKKMNKIQFNFKF